MKKICLFFCAAFILVGSCTQALSTFGGEDAGFYYLNLDKATVARGFTVSAFNQAIKLSIVPGVLDDASDVEIIKLNESIDLPWQLEKLSEVYQFEFKNKSAYNKEKPFWLQLKYDQKSNYYKQVYFYDKTYNSWRPLPTLDNPESMTVRSLIHLPFARLAVFANSEALTMGKASWYNYKKGNFAASPDFPKKSRLRVYNTDNGKFVDVEINDFGPERIKHPDRVLDLEKTAFKKIALSGQGIINIRVEPLYIALAAGRILGIKPEGATLRPQISAKSAMVMDESTGKIIYEKMATTTLPLASLSKLVAVKVFLDAKPSLNQVVSYSLKDEEYNYQYCNKWESAKLNLKDGETLTIENLLYGALVGSANNAIESLVRVSGWSRSEFINKMNETVLGWGASSTYFVEPTGLSPENVSSALDYAIITKEVYTHPIIQKASIMAEYKFSTINTKKAHRLKNTNQLLFTSNLNIIGSKTGYLDEALYCLMIRAKGKSGNNIIAVTFGAPTRDESFAGTEELVRYGMKKLD